MEAGTAAPKQAGEGKEFERLDRPADGPAPKRPQQPDLPEREGKDAVAAAARGEKLTDDELVNATDWMLEEDDGPIQPYYIKVNVGGPVDEDGEPLDREFPPKWLRWGIIPVGLDEIKKIRRQSQDGNRRQRRVPGGGEIDENKFGVAMIVAGTADPNVAAVAQKKGLVDPGDAVRDAFKKKPGLIQQISGQVMDLSGYNDADIREADAGKP